MQRTQIQLPDHLFEAGRSLARRQEISFAELVRRGLEYLIATQPRGSDADSPWELPPGLDLRSRDPFQDQDWRANLYDNRLCVAETLPDYKARKRKSKRRRK